MTLAYVDTSALAKLLVEEPESAAVRHLMPTIRAVSSVLAGVELAALVRRRAITGGDALVDAVTSRMRLLELSPTLLQTARRDVRRPPGAQPSTCFT